MFHHFLVVASALFMGSSADSLAHHPVEVPFASVLLSSFNHLFEFQEEAHISLVLLFIPVGSGEFFVVGGGGIKTINHLFRSKHPRLDSVTRDKAIVDILRVTFGKAFKWKHVIH